MLRYIALLVHQVLPVGLSSGFIKSSFLGHVGKCSGNLSEPDKFFCIKHLVFPGYFLDTPESVIGNPGFSGLSPVCSDKNDTVGPAGSINGCRRSVLQYVNARDIPCVQVVHAAVKGNTVDNNQWVVAGI